MKKIYLYSMFLFITFIVFSILDIQIYYKINGSQNSYIKTITMKPYYNNVSSNRGFAFICSKKYIEKVNKIEVLQENLINKSALLYQGNEFEKIIQLKDNIFWSNKIILKGEFIEKDTQNIVKTNIIYTPYIEIGIKPLWSIISSFDIFPPKIILKYHFSN